MTNKEQIWRERMAVIKDVLFSMAPGLVVFVIFIGLTIATGRINAQWQEGVRARRASVNSLAVDQLKDFAVIQAGTDELDTLPEGIDANRFVADNQAFVAFVKEYFNWNGFNNYVEIRERAEERIGDYTAFWDEVYFRMTSGVTPERPMLVHKTLFGETERSSTVLDNKVVRYRNMAQSASVADTHAIEIMPNGSYMYFAIVPTYRYFEYSPNDFSRDMCMGVWYTCDENSVITPVQVRWLTSQAEEN